MGQFRKAVMFGALALALLSDSATSLAQSPGRLNLTMVMGGENLVTVPVLYARAAGLFEKAGLDIKWLPVTQTGTIPLTDSGESDVALTTMALALGAQATGKDLVVVAMISQGLFSELILTTDAIKKLPASITVKSSVQDKLQAIKGMKITTALAGTSTDLSLRALLEKYNVNPDKDIVLVPNGDLNNVVLTAKAGRVDGYFTGPPNTSISVQQGWGVVWVDTISQQEVKMLDEAPQAVIIAKRPTIRTKSEELKRYMNALKEALKDIRERPDLVRDTIKPRFFENIDPKTFELAFDKSRKLYEHDLIATQKGFDQQLSTVNIVDSDGKKASVPYEKAFDFSALK
jgi:NitT/TauT family transport system substrate-binding protein